MMEATHQPRSNQQVGVEPGHALRPTSSRFCWRISQHNCDDVRAMASHPRDMRAVRNGATISLTRFDFASHDRRLTLSGRVFAGAPRLLSLEASRGSGRLQPLRWNYVPLEPKQTFANWRVATSAKIDLL